MNKVKVGELRNNLSKYLKEVRLGIEYTIQDRDTPIGRLVPYLRDNVPAEKLEMIPPKKGYGGLASFRSSRKDHCVTFDGVEEILRDRRRR